MTPFKWTLSWEYVQSQVAILVDMGFDVARAYDLVGINTNGHAPRRGERISAERLLPLFSAAEQDFDDCNIGLKVGNRFRVSHFGETGRIFTQCENIRDVSQKNARYQPLALDMARIWFSEDTDPVTEEKKYAHNYELYDHPSVEDANTYKHLIDLVFGAYGTAFRWLSWGSAKELKGVSFQYSEPPNTRDYSEIFNCPIRFDEPHNAIWIDEDVAFATISTYDAVKRAQMISRLDAMLDQSLAATSFADALSKTIRRQITQGRLTRPLVAEALGLSASKFSEALKSSGVTYKEEVDRVRRDMIEDLIASGASFTEMAQALGYNDQAAFNKAFQRLYGVSPTQYKASLA